MKHSKIKILAALFSCSLLAVGLGIGCTDKGKTSASSSEPSEHVSSLIGFDIPESGNYYYGDCITVLDPLVLDDIGNVMDIVSTVKNASGETVSTEYGKFFAEDKNGYTVEYKITTLDGKTHVKTMAINVIEAIKETQVKLVEIGDKTTYDLLSLLPDDQKATIEKFKDSGMVSYSLTPANATESVPLTDTTIDFTVNEKAYYNFKVEFPMGNDEKVEAIYTCGVDFYSEKDGMVWQSDNGLSLSDLICKDVESRTKMQKSIVSGDDLPDGAVADEYYLVSIPASLEYDVYAFSVVGIHSKAYYEMFHERSKESGIAYNLEYDFYHYTTTPVKNEEGEEYNFTHFTINGEEIQPSMHEWHTVSISIGDLLEKWDSYADIMQYNSQANMIWSNSVSHYHHDLIGYWGNFRTTRTTETTENDGAILVDMNGKSSFELMDILDEETKTRLETYMANGGEIVWTLNGEQITDFSALEGVYDVVATLKTATSEDPVYMSQVDFYNSADGLVWIKGLSMDNLMLKQSAMTGEIVTSGLPEGATASEYYHVSVPTTTAQTSGYTLSVTAIHSKAYYEMMLAQAQAELQSYTLKFDFYHTSQDLLNAGYNMTYFHVGGEPVEAYSVGEWYTLEIPLETLIKHFNGYADMTNISGDGSYSDEVNMIYSTEAQYYGYDTDGYFGNFRFEKKSKASVTGSETVALVDKNGKTELTLDDLVEENARAQMETYAQYGEIVWTFNGRESVDLTTLEGVYQAVALLRINGSDSPIYKRTVDFYNSADGLVWINGLSMENLVCKLPEMTGEIVTSGLPEGATASEYYHVSVPTTEAQTSGYTLSVTAIHSKAYYEMMLAQAQAELQSYTLKFDFYHTSQGLTDAGYSMTYFHVGGAPVEAYSVGEWYTLEISLETLIKHFNGYADMTNIKGDGSYSDEVNMIYSTEAQYYGYDTDGYFGNFRFEKKSSATMVENEEILLVDLNGKTEIDYDALVDADNKAMLEEYATRGELVWTVGGEEVTDISALEGVYEVLASLKVGSSNIDVYKRTVDFYNSANGIVWLNGLSMDNLKLKQSAMIGEIATDELPEGATASEYYHVSVPTTEAQTSGYTLSVTAIHSKAYYEMMLANAQAAGKNYVLKFDFYHTSQDLSNAGYSSTGFYIGGSDQALYSVSTWHTLEISLETVLRHFDAYADLNNQKGHPEHEEDAVNMMYSAEAQYYGYDTDGYLGNFRFEEI